MAHIAIIICGHDGLSSCYTGVGIVVSEYLMSISNFLRSENDFDLLSFGPMIDKTSEIYNDGLHRQTNNKSNYSQYKTLKSPNRAPNIWGGIKEWVNASKQLSDLIDSINRKYKHIFVLANDSIFLNTREWIKNKGNNVTFYYILHSFSNIFQDSFSGPERLDYEKRCFSLFDENDKIVYLSRFIQDTIKNSLSINCKSILLCNGVPQQLDMIEYKPNYTTIKDFLNRKEDYHFVFIGRSGKQKGILEFLIRFQKEIKSIERVSIIVISPNETDQDQYYQQLEAHLDENYEKYIIIGEFIKNISKEIFSSIKKGCVIFNSEYEVAPITPLESICYCDPSVAIAYSEIAPHLEIFKKMPHTYPINNALFSRLYLTNKKHRFLSKKYSFELSSKLLLESIHEDINNI